MSIFTGYDPGNGACAINQHALALTDEVQRAPTDFLFAAQTWAPGQDLLRSNSNVASDRGGRRQYGPYERPGLQRARTTLPGQRVERAPDVPVPKDVTGLCVLPGVESRQQKLLVSHLIKMTDA